MRFANGDSLILNLSGTRNTTAAEAFTIDIWLRTDAYAGPQTYSCGKGQFAHQPLDAGFCVEQFRHQLAPDRGWMRWISFETTSGAVEVDPDCSFTVARDKDDAASGIFRCANVPVNIESDFDYPNIQDTLAITGNWSLSAGIRAALDDL